jgi:membrane associated rhomboid family serine protease
MRNYRYSGGQYHRPGFFGGGFSFFPPVIKTLLITNLIVFVLMFFLGSFRIGNVPLYNYITYYFALMPLGSGAFLPWQLFTYLFMHGGLMHLFFNMFALWMFGMELENTWGSKKFLIFYLTCGIGAGLTNLLIAPLFTTVGPTVGASGSVYGVLLAFAMMYPDRPIFIYFLFPVKAKYFITFFIILELFNGVAGTQSGVAHFAHLGGALVAFIYLMADSDRIPVRRWFSGFHTDRSRHLRYHKGEGDVQDAKFYEVRDDKRKKDPEFDQERIDEILDKISKSGYQNLTEEEKRILFEASQKLK